MKIKKILLVFIISIMFIPFMVNAETCENDKVFIESIEAKSISDNVVEKNEPVINGMGVKLDLEMSEVGDKIEYEMTIKNDSNTDYKLDKNSLNIESDYMDYTFETKDKTNVVKAKSRSEAMLTVQYRNEVPEELLEDGSFTENKIISIVLNDGKGLINPKTGQSLLFIISLLLIVVTISLIVLKKNKRISLLILLFELVLLPFSVYALCNINLKIESNVAVEKKNECHAFDNDSSWEDIIQSIKNNKIECMHVGDTKEVDMGSFGTHTLRISNTSTPAECSIEGFSQTACGFVVEFADIINNHVMNDTGTNVGGWPATSMRSYINNDIYNSLPKVIKDAIIDTTVVSNHGSDVSSDFISIDKLYLLSRNEITGSNYPEEPSTRMLDYYNPDIYNGNGSKSTKNDGSAEYWWLRTLTPNYDKNFYYVENDGFTTNYIAYVSNGVSPAFRIG